MATVARWVFYYTDLVVVVIDLDSLDVDDGVSCSATWLLSEGTDEGFLFGYGVSDESRRNTGSSGEASRISLSICASVGTEGLSGRLVVDFVWFPRTIVWSNDKNSSSFPLALSNYNGIKYPNKAAIEIHLTIMHSKIP